jgi:tetratricopeptide (TPR) repeat protein
MVLLKARVLVQVLLAEAEECKSRGNDLFKQQQHAEAIEEYDKALEVAPPDASQRAIYHANKAACLLALEDYKACIGCCSEALRVNPDYLKALRRKMTAHERLDELENAWADAKRVRAHWGNTMVPATSPMCHSYQRIMCRLWS